MSPLFIFVLARQCKALADKGVMSAVGMLSSALRELAAQSRGGNGQSQPHSPHQHHQDNSAAAAAAIGAAGADDAQELARLVNDTRARADGLLLHYVAMNGTKIAQMLRKSIETPNWLKHPSPRDVRLVIGLVLEEIARMSQQVAQTLGNDGGNGGGGGGGGGAAVAAAEDEGGGGRSAGGGGSSGAGAPPSRGRGAGASAALDIERIFAKKVVIFGNVDFSRDSIVTGVFKISLKTCFECIRLCTFGKNGYQQLQVR